MTAVEGQYLTLDVTVRVVTWLATPTPGGFGVAITADGTTTALIASKEGAGSGHPAILEIDLATSTVGGVPAANVAAGANAANAATSANTASTIVMRDASGNFSASTVTATGFSGNGAGLTNIPASAVVTPPPGMVLIPAGAFTMGDSLDGDSNATPISTTVSAFYMDVNEVSLSQWEAVQQWATLVGGYTGLAAGSGKGAAHPVQTVNWFNCVKWCNARSEREGKTPVYYMDGAQTTVYRTGSLNVDNARVKWSANGYRLPTEAEWKKAARGGLAGKRFPWGDTISQKQANYNGDTAGHVYDLGPNGFNAIGSIGGTSPATSPVGSFAANGYGLNDMTGNVFELCWDSYGIPHAGGSDPHGPATNPSRVLRGGGWGFGARGCRSAWRDFIDPGYADISMGFRAVLSPGQP